MDPHVAGVHFTTTVRGRPVAAFVTAGYLVKQYGAPDNGAGWLACARSDVAQLRHAARLVFEQTGHEPVVLSNLASE